MAACLYCKQDAGEAGYHEACIPRPAARASTLAAQRTPLASPPVADPPRRQSTLTSVRVVDVDMPFGSMVNFMVKWALASIPAFIILAILGFVLVAGLRALTFGR